MLGDYWMWIATLVALGGAALYYLRRAGLFHRIVVSTGAPPIGAVTIAYKFARGRYEECGAIFEDVLSVCPDLKCMGIYYDDPEKVPAHALRYVVASILPNDEGKMAKLELLESRGYKAFDLPEVQTAVISAFPFTCKLSVFLGVWRVYPRIGSYIEENHLKPHPSMEIYSDMGFGGQIKYMWPLEKQEEFYVPETGGVDAAI